VTEDPIKFWQHIHGASSHFPIALLIFAWLFDVGGTILGRREWRVIGFWAVIAAAVISFPAIGSGLTGQLGWFGAKTWEAESLILHRNVALASGGLSQVLAIWRIIRGSKISGGEWIFYLVLLTAGVGIVGYTGFLGAYVARGY